MNTYQPFVVIKDLEYPSGFYILTYGITVHGETLGGGVIKIDYQNIMPIKWRKVFSDTLEDIEAVDGIKGAILFN